MDYQTSGEAIVTERKSHLVLLLIILGVVVTLALTVWGYQLYKNNQTTPEPYLVADFDSYGLSETAGEDDVLFGHLTYTVLTAEEDSLPYTYQYNVLEDSSELTSYLPLQAIIPMSSTTELVLASLSENYDSSSWQPQLFIKESETLVPLPNVAGHNLRDLTLSPDGTRYAYSYQTSMNPAPEAGSLSDWNIAIHTLQTDDVITIEAAAEPEWIHEGGALIYTATDGIYYYDLNTGETSLLFSGYSPLKEFDDIAVSPDSSAVILTVSGSNLLSVLKFKNPDELTTLELTEIGRITSPNVGYSSPVFSRDGRHYALVASKFAVSFDSGAPQLDSVTRTIEIRHINNAAVIKVISGTTTAANQLKLAGWF